MSITFAWSVKRDEELSIQKINGFRYYLRHETFTAVRSLQETDTERKNKILTYYL